MDYANIEKQLSKCASNLVGFGGHCASAARAINSVLFENKAELKGVFNKSLYLRGFYVGHVYVYVKAIDRAIDADGLFVTENSLLEYGSLEKISEYTNLLEEFIIRPLKDSDYSDVVVQSLAGKNQSVLDFFDMAYLEHNTKVLKDWHLF